MDQKCYFEIVKINILCEGALSPPETPYPTPAKKNIPSFIYPPHDSHLLHRPHFPPHFETAPATTKCNPEKKGLKK